MKHIELPLSKSVVNRLLIAIAAQGNLPQWLTENPSVLSNGCRDTRLLISALLNFQEGQSHFDFQDAGTPCRLFTAFAAVNAKQPVTIIGNASLNNRSISPLVNALVEMGAEIDYLEKAGFTPIRIRKTIDRWTDIAVNTEISSQFASALLLVAPKFVGKKRITLQNTSHSQTYIDLTIQILQQMGIEIDAQIFENNRVITILGDYRSASNQILKPITVEADWSSAAFFYSLLLGMDPSSTLFLKHLTLKSMQGDVAMAALGERLGIVTTSKEEGVLLSRIEENLSQQNHINLNNNPDLVPALVVGLCILKKSAMLEGIGNLRFKECDRIAALQENLSHLHCTLTPLGEESEDLWILDSSNRIYPDSMHVETRHDHRIAMAFSALQPWIPELSYSDSACVEKSFPNYWEQMKKCTFE